MIKKPLVVLLLFCMLGVLTTALLSGCATSRPAVSSPQTTPSSPSVITSPTVPAPADKPWNPPAAVPPSQGAAPSLKTDVIYFHVTQRCVTCLCFESRIKFVVDTYYKDAIGSGKMTFSVLNAQEKQNAELVKKYKAVGSQLFVNTIINGVDHIRDIQEIWDWDCNKDPNGFMQKVQSIIDKSLKGL